MEGKYVKKNIIPLGVNIHSRDTALVVHYEVEDIVLGDRGEPIDVKTTTQKKKIKVEILEKSNLRKMAEEIVQNNKIIESSQVSRIESLLKELHLAQYGNKITDESNHSKIKSQKIENKPQEEGEDDEKVNQNRAPARLDQLDDYIEMVYNDDMESKIQGVMQIFELTEIIENLETLLQNESLITLLSRILREEYKKSYGLVFLLMKLFRNFSNYPVFHEQLSNNRLGRSTMKIIDFEIKRHQLRLEEEEKSVEKARRGGGNEESKQNSRRTEKEIESIKRQTKKQVKNQDKLLYVCLSVLLNLAQDIHAERKMVSGDIIPFLIHMLDRASTDLVVLSLLFLKKLSIIEDNKDIMKYHQVIQKVSRLIPSNSDLATKISLKLLFNLSFDSTLRDIMVKNSLIPKFVDVLKKPIFRALTLRLLYHLSIEDRCKSMFTYTEAIPIIMQLVINFPQNMVANELIALAINLSHTERNAELMCQRDGLKDLMSRVVRTRDPLLMKVVRNISQWSHNLQQEVASIRLYKYRGLWSPFVKPLLQLAQEIDNHDLLVDVLGTLNNITPYDLPPDQTWSSLVEAHSIIPFLHKLMVPGFSQDDMVLEVVLFVSTLMLDAGCAPLLKNSRLIRIFHGLLQEQNDEEITLQVLFCFYRMLRHSILLEELLYGRGILSDLLEVSGSQNTEVRKMCDVVCDLILDHDSRDRKMGELGKQIRLRRFEVQNAEYMEIILELSDGMEDSMDAEELGDSRHSHHKDDMDLEIEDEKNADDDHYKRHK